MKKFNLFFLIKILIYYLNLIELTNAQLNIHQQRQQLQQTTTIESLTSASATATGTQRPGCPYLNDTISSRLNRLLDFNWLVTNPSGSKNNLQFKSKRNFLYEISLCKDSTLCATGSSSDSISICKLINQNTNDTNTNTNTNPSNKIESKSIQIGYKSTLKFQQISDGYLLKFKGEKCGNITDSFYMTYIFLHCDKTIGLPVLLVDDSENLSYMNMYRQDLLPDFDDGEGQFVCKIVFDWRTNQVCNDKRFYAQNEMPCYLTSTDKSSEIKNDLDNYYMTVDFTDLMKTSASKLNSLSNFYEVVEFNDDIDILVDVCRYGTPNIQNSNCPTDNAACVSFKNGSYISFGFAANNLSGESAIRKITNRHYKLVYDLLNTSLPNSSSCNRDGKANTPTAAKMTINFLCPSTPAGSKSPILQTIDGCDYEIDWYTQHACGTHNYMQTENSCMLYDSKKNIDIDLTQLNNPLGYTLEAKSGRDTYQYVINICGPLANVKSYNSLIDDFAALEMSAVQLKPSDKTFFKLLGQYRQSRLVYSNNQLKMIMDGGDVCGTKMSRKISIDFKCDSNKMFKTEAKMHRNQTSIGNQIRFINDVDCIYYFEWTTSLACVYDCSLEYKKNLYDLQPLMRQNGEFWPLVNSLDEFKNIQHTNIILNVCNNLKLDMRPIDQQDDDEITKRIRIMTEKCPMQSSICAYNEKTNTTVNLGVFNTDLEMDIKDNGLEYLRLVYTNGDICESASQRRITTIINFICDLNSDLYAGLNMPKLSYISTDSCLYEIYWRTREACAKSRLVSNDCVIQSGNGEIYFNFTDLSNENEIFEALHDAEFDYASDNYQNATQSNTKYAFQICGKHLSSLSKPSLTFWDYQDASTPNQSFQFSQNPKLIYDNGLLYFKYENEETKKHAIVKLECSDEEMIISNSNDLKLLKYAIKELVIDLDSNLDNDLSPSIAFVLWKTKHACLSGSNELSNHFQPYLSLLSQTETPNDETTSCIIYETSTDNTTSAWFRPTNLIDLTKVYRPHYVDLRILLKKFHADEKDLEVMIDDASTTTTTTTTRFYTRLCSKSFTYSTYSKNDSNSFGCLLTRDEQNINETKIINLGTKLNNVELTNRLNGDLKLTYINGDLCPSMLTSNGNDNSSTRYSFEIHFKCWPKKQQYLTFIRTSRNGCTYYFEWLTNDVCKKQHETDTNNSNRDDDNLTGKRCKVNDPYTDDDIDFNNNYNYFHYDFNALKSDVYVLNETRLKLNYDLDDVRGDGYFKLAVCKQLGQNECGNLNGSVASCFLYNHTSQTGPTILNQGLANDKLTFENGLVSLTYSNGQTCTKSRFDSNIELSFDSSNSSSSSSNSSLLLNDRSSSTRIEFYCDYNEEKSQLKYLYFSQFKCQHVIGFYTYLACPPYLSRENIDFKCQIQFDVDNNEKTYKLKTTKLSSLSSVNTLMLLFESDDSYFSLRFQNYRLVFSLCGLLPHTKQIVTNPSLFNKVEKKSFVNRYGKCFDRYGNALGSACLYDENVIEQESETGDLVVKQINLGLSKGPFRKSFTQTVPSYNLTYYSMAFTSGDKCDNQTDAKIQLNVLFKCVKSFNNDGAYARGDTGSNGNDSGGNYETSNSNNKNYKIELMSSSDKCKLNVQIEMESFCRQAERLEHESLNELETSKQSSSDHVASVDVNSEFYCTINETIGDKMFRVYNLSTLATNVFKLDVAELNKIFSFKICNNIKQTECPTATSNPSSINPGVCVFDKNTNKICYQSNFNTNFRIIQDSYRLRLIYAASTNDSSLTLNDECTNSKYDLIIDLICNTAADSSTKPEPTLKSIESKRIYLEIRTKHACPVTKFLKKDNSIGMCNYYPYDVNPDNEYYYDEYDDTQQNDLLDDILDDLIGKNYLKEEDAIGIEQEIIDFTETEYSYTSKKSMSSYDPSFPNLEFYFNLCSGKSSYCKEDSAVCMYDNTKLESTSLGNVHSVSYKGGFKGKRLYYRRDKSGIYLLYTNGKLCPSGGGGGGNKSSTGTKQVYHSSRINLICYDPLVSNGLEQSLVPEFIYHNPTTCRYYFDWHTPLACLASSKKKTNSTNNDANTQTTQSNEKIYEEFVNECKIYNPLHNYTFDLSELYINESVNLTIDNSYHVKSEKYEYLINICRPKTHTVNPSDSNIAILRKELNETTKDQAIVFGYFNQMSISHLTSHIIISYDGDTCGSALLSGLKRNLVILFECSPFVDMEPTIVSEEECSITLQWAVKSACIKKELTNYKDTCSAYYAGKLYDLKPLTHSFDSWTVNTSSSSSSYWLNVCKGILKGPDDKLNCPQNAAVCVRDNLSNKVETLAYTDQMYLKVQNDAYAIEMIYNNTRRACYSKTNANQLILSYTIVYIELKCGQTIGKPELNQNFSQIDQKEKPTFLMTTPFDCIIAFEWKTRMACRNSTEIMSRVDVINGVMIDSKHSKVRIDMSDILLSPNGFVDEYDQRPNSDDNFKYYIHFNGKNPKFQVNKRDAESTPQSNCADSIVCQVNEKSNTFNNIGNKIDYYSFDVYTQILEVGVLSENNKCKSQDSMVMSIIRFYCDPNRNGNEFNTSFNFETEFEQCIYMFDWPTNKLCVKELWANGSYDVFSDDSETGGIIHYFPAPVPPGPPASDSHPKYSGSSTGIPSFVVIFLILLIIVTLLLLFNNHEKIINSRFCVMLSTCCSKLKSVDWFGRTTRGLRHMSPNRWIRSSSGSISSRLRGVRYKRLRNQGKNQTYVRLDNSLDDTDDLLNSSGDEVTALFNEKDEQAVLRLSELTPLATNRNNDSINNNNNNQTVPTIRNKQQSAKFNLNNKISSQSASNISHSNFNNDLDDSLLDLDDGDLSIRNSSRPGRRGSKNNMLSNTDTDDDLINIT